MKSFVLVFLMTVANVSFSADTQTVRGTNSIQPIHVDCRHSVTLSRELESVVADPQQNPKRWQRVFAAIEGFETAEQRLKSAKSVLWTVRTQCQGF